MGWAGWMSGWMSDDACASLSFLDFVGNAAHTLFGVTVVVLAVFMKKTALVRRARRWYIIRNGALQREAQKQAWKSDCSLIFSFKFFFYFSYTSSFLCRFFISVFRLFYLLLVVSVSPLLLRVVFCWVSSHSPRPLLTPMVYPLLVCMWRKKQIIINF